jgi:hypothetical protein
MGPAMKSNIKIGFTNKSLIGFEAYFHTGFLLGIFLDPEDGGDMFL